MATSGNKFLVFIETLLKRSMKFRNDLSLPCRMLTKAIKVSATVRLATNWALNLAFRVQKQSMLCDGRSKNHSNASPVREVEKTRHQMASLAA